MKTSLLLLAALGVLLPVIGACGLPRLAAGAPTTTRADEASGWLHVRMPSMGVSFSVPYNP